VDQCGRFIAANFPTQVLSTADQDQVLKAYMAIWREVCHFSTVSLGRNGGQKSAGMPDIDADEVNSKRAVYLRTQMRLVLRSQMDSAEKVKQYAECISKANMVVDSSNGDLRQYSGIARELVAFYPDVAGKLADQMHKQLVDWLGGSVESPLILLLMHTAEALQPQAIETGLELVDECIGVYFKRK